MQALAVMCSEDAGRMQVLAVMCSEDAASLQVLAVMCNVYGGRFPGLLAYRVCLLVSEWPPQDRDVGQVLSENGGRDNNNNDNNTGK